MSDERNRSNAINEDDVCNLQVICGGIPKHRARELLMAATGSMERAVHLYFEQSEHRSSDSTYLEVLNEQLQVNDIVTSGGKLSSSNNRASSAFTSPSSPEKKQSTLHSFSQTPSPNNYNSNKTRQTKMLSYFAVSPKQNYKRVKTSEEVTCDNGSTNETSANCNDVLAKANNTIDNQFVCLTDAPESATFGSTESRSNEHKPTASVLVNEEDVQPPRDTSPDLPYSLLANTFAQMTATTKRTLKTQALEQLFHQVIVAVGDGTGNRNEYERDHGPLLLACVLDLITGTLLALSSNSRSGAPQTSTSTPSDTALHVSDSAISAAIQTITGASRERVRLERRATGDLGTVAANLWTPPHHRARQFFVAAQSRPNLTVLNVHSLLRSIANVQPGKRSQKDRQNLLLKLLRGAHEKEEIRFLVRTLLGNMRLGATMKTAVAALAVAIEQARGGVADDDVKRAPQRLQQVFNLCPRVHKIAAALLTGGVPFAEQSCSLEVGFPVQPMLANPVSSMDQVKTFLTPRQGIELTAFVEYKYDGVRCQAHWDGVKVNLFSRNMLDNTAQYPDAVEYMLTAKKSTVSSFIIDSEIVGVAISDKGRDGFRLLPFQDLSTRRGIKGAADDRIQIRVYAFDLLLLNGESLIHRPLFERRTLLEEHFEPSSGFAFTTSFTFDGFDQTRTEQALTTAISEGAEGLMVKLTGKIIGADALQPAVVEPMLDMSFGYESGTRSRTWKKLKKDYVGDYADTIDVVPIGAWYGDGRKAEMGFLSPILLAVYDEDEGAFCSISRCMSFSDDMYKAMREFYFQGIPYPTNLGLIEPKEATERQDGNDEIHILKQSADASDDFGHGQQDEDRVNCFVNRPSPSWIITNENPPIWFKPLEVFEVSFADLSLSRVHTASAGMVPDDQERGVALRFPRFKRRRPDKTIEEATTTAQIAELFGRQSKHLG
jgi:DNA ligase-1